MSLNNTVEFFKLSITIIKLLLIKTERFDPKVFFSSIQKTKPNSLFIYVYRLRNLLKKQARLENHLTFLMKCRNNNIIPKGLRIRLPVYSRKAHIISARTSRALLRERIGYTRRQKIKNHLNSCSIRLELRLDTSPQTLQALIEWAEHHKKEEFSAVKKQQQEKFQLLLKEKERYKGFRTSTKQNVVVNLSRKALTVEQE